MANIPKNYANLVDSFLSQYVGDEYALYKELISKFFHFANANVHKKVFNFTDNTSPYTVYNELMDEFYNQYFKTIDTTKYSLSDRIQQEQLVRFSKPINNAKGLRNLFHFIFSYLKDFNIVYKDVITDAVTEITVGKINWSLVEFLDLTLDTVSGASLGETVSFSGDGVVTKAIGKIVGITGNTIRIEINDIPLKIMFVDTDTGYSDALRNFASESAVTGKIQEADPRTPTPSFSYLLYDNTKEFLVNDKIDYGTLSYTGADAVIIKNILTENITSMFDIMDEVDFNSLAFDNKDAEILSIIPIPFEYEIELDISSYIILDLLQFLNPAGFKMTIRELFKINNFDGPRNIITAGMKHDWRVKEITNTDIREISFGVWNPRLFRWDDTDEDDRAALSYLDNENVILDLADASNFTETGDITGDGTTGNDGEGTVTEIKGNQVSVNITSGTFAVNGNVDNANPYVSSETTINSYKPMNKDGSGHRVYKRERDISGDENDQGLIFRMGDMDNINLDTEDGICYGDAIYFASQDFPIYLEPDGSPPIPESFNTQTFWDNYYGLLIVPPTISAYKITYAGALAGDGGSCDFGPQKGAGNRGTPWEYWMTRNKHDFFANFDLNITGGTGANDKQWFLFGIQESDSDVPQHSLWNGAGNAGADIINIGYVKGSGLRIQAKNEGSPTIISSGFASISESTLYYVTFRVMRNVGTYGTAYLEVYTDPLRQAAPVAAVSLTLTTKSYFTMFHLGQGDGTFSFAATIDYYLENLNLGPITSIKSSVVKS
jgi:hypothetical protein